MTLLSKDNVGKVVDVLSQVIKGKIADEDREAGMFSVQIETTQDVTSKDQCAIIVRYVTNAIHEQLVAVVDCEKSTGKYLTELLKHTLEKLNIDIGTCVVNSTDGAANMQGQYKGFSAFLSEQSPTQIHVWCYAHVLNLVLADTTGSVIEMHLSFHYLMKWQFSSESHISVCRGGKRQVRTNVTGDCAQQGKQEGGLRIRLSLKSLGVLVIPRMHCMLTCC